MKRRLFFLLTILLVFGFSATAMRDTTQPKLKEKVVTAETLIASGNMAKSKKLNTQQLSALSVKKMDKGFDAHLQYKLIDTLYKNNSHYILLLGQWYDYENKAWIAAYAAPHQLIDYKLVFYDNAEGFLSVETAIKQNIITITTINEYEAAGAQKKKEQFRFGANYKLQKL